MKSRPDLELQGRVAFLEDVIESLPIGVMILDNSGKLLMMNRYQEKISRIERKMVLGSHYHNSWKRLFDQGFYGNKYWRLLNNKEPFTFIFHDILPQFYDIVISGICYGAPLFSTDGVILLHDVSDELGHDKHILEQLANQLAESSEFMGNLIDSSPNLVFSTEAGGFIQTSNTTSERILGYTKGDFLWKHISTIIANPLQLEELLSSGHASKLELTCKKKNGTLFPVRAQVSDIKKTDGSCKSKLFIFEDITWEKNMEDKLKLSERLAIYSELMAGIAHQLNNPLIGVVNFSSLLLGSMSSEDPNKELAETINEAASECLMLVRSMMKGIYDPQSTFHDLNVNEIVDGALKALLDQAYFKPTDIRIRKLIPEAIPKIKGDTLQLFEVFRNILKNAFQAMPDGGRLDIGINVSARNKEVRVWFKDTGHGISKEHLPRVFTPFFSTKEGKGTGLGLSFAFQVIKSHSGRIIVKSLENRGTTVVVVLPIYTEEGHFEYFD